MKPKKKSAATVSQADVEILLHNLTEGGGLACPECLTRITQKNILCPACGLDIQKYEDTHCPECEEEHDEFAISCEDCGAEFE